MLPERRQSLGIMQANVTRRQLFFLPGSARKIAEFGQSLKVNGDMLEAAMRASNIVLNPPNQPLVTPSSEPSVQHLSEQPETIEIVENPYREENIMLNNALNVAATIKDWKLRIDTFEYIGKIAVIGSRLEMAGEAQRRILDEWRQSNSESEVSKRALRASAQIELSREEYHLLDGLMRNAIPDANWYQELAVAKGKKWLEGGKTDDSLDPTEDLEKAKAFLTKPQEAGIEDTKPYAEYAKAYFKATWEVPDELIMASNLFEKLWMKYEDAIDLPENVLPIISKEEGIKLMDHVEALATVFSETGQTIEARDTVFDFTLLPPNTVELSQKVAQAYQKIANKALTYGTDRELDMANAIATEALGVIERMQEGEQKDRLIAEVGVDMYLIRTYIEINRFEKTQERRPSGEDLTNAWNRVISLSDSTLKSTASRTFGKGIARFKKVTPNATKLYLEYAQEQLDSVYDVYKTKTNDIAIEYGSLAKDYVEFGFIDEAKKVLEKIKPLAVNDKTIASYAEAMADVAKAEALQISKRNL